MRNDMLVELNEKCAEWLSRMALEQGVEISDIVEALISSFEESCKDE